MPQREGRQMVMVLVMVITSLHMHDYDHMLTDISLVVSAGVTLYGRRYLRLRSR